MIATTHLAVGAIVGLWGARLADISVAHKAPYVQPTVQVGVAFLAGTLSHFALDAISHSEAIYKLPAGKWPVLFPELVLIFGVIFWLCYVRDLDFLIVFAGVVGAAWLDAIRMVNIPGFSDSYLAYQIESFHSRIHSDITLGPIPSLPIQALIAVVALIFLI